METFVANGHSTGLDHAAEQRRDQGKRPARARRVGLRANRHNVLLTKPTEPAAGSTALRGGVDRAKAHNFSDCAATALRCTRRRFVVYRCFNVGMHAAVDTLEHGLPRLCGSSVMSQFVHSSY